MKEPHNSTLMGKMPLSIAPHVLARNFCEPGQMLSYEGAKIAASAGNPRVLQTGKAQCWYCGIPDAQHCYDNILQLMSRV